MSSWRLLHVLLLPLLATTSFHLPTTRRHHLQHLRADPQSPFIIRDFSSADQLKSIVDLSSRSLPQVRTTTTTTTTTNEVVRVYSYIHPVRHIFFAQTSAYTLSLRSTLRWLLLGPKKNTSLTPRFTPLLKKSASRRRRPRSKILFHLPHRMRIH